ncbi:sigma-70 family RNA polymerase sigma factor [Variovorax sp. NFACC27]|uniref:RNA polymerase sigma factor n=1 Tax=unclassified Variovorax TaxID=663243 RepID=UPI000899A264|nr:RNA polymerase sigma-70 factor (ECF subfamily) [Variovorax paradoxus]SEF27901.1 RNA polymerase sigma-70 factor, ECF subfamily [Variovorax sp. NFACC28]SEG70747.1 RNA polymerase sigma-70 factor, ECF subfamily [Variovorax sp. NFACC29]SFC81934.1 RNA polymerase sigma-70 factor, ECF subfamily [Variovorax sp. NFACC26]SFF98559.1 RNA polymerase sigma-70 factor, ECF subfamily [Variovorax sp. NFACC27]
MDARLLVEHIPSLRRYARALTGNAWAADDLVQDTLERACSKWRLWVVGSDLRAWLFTVMHNIFASQVRRTPPPHAVVPLDEVVQEVQGMADSSRDQSTGIDLQRCLMQLPEEQRAVLLLVTLEDLSYAEVARVLGVPVGTVMSRLSRARVRLQELMDGASPAVRPGLRRLK